MVNRGDISRRAETRSIVRRTLSACMHSLQVNRRVRRTSAMPVADDKLPLSRNGCYKQADIGPSKSRDEEAAEILVLDSFKSRSTLQLLSSMLFTLLQSWRLLVMLITLLVFVWALRAHGDSAVLFLSSGEQPLHDPWDMEPDWSILELWWAALVLEYIGPPLFFLTHRILDPLCFVAGAEILFLTISGLWLYGCGRQWLPENTRWVAKPLPIDPTAVVDHSIYPKVVVQLPMYNERQVYARAIAAACSLTWPADCLLVQVLDDSTMRDVSESMKRAVDMWQKRGVNVVYKKRMKRKGFKAGNLREGLQEEYIKDYEFVAVFDADFEPAADWLLKTVHHLKEHPELALVQTRWTFLNAQECDLTRYQEVELKWHFLTEQLTGSYFHNFFGFNGTAGIWRLAAIMEAGNWRDDTTVEDMDMAFCTTMLGWHFLFLPHVTCPSELPATCEAYRKQQRRWSSGPVDLAKKRIGAIWASKKMRFWHKLYVMFVFIGLRKALRSAVIFLSVGVVFPLALILPESLIEFPPYGLIAHVVIYNVCLFIVSPEYILLLPGYALFANSMALLRLRAIFAGLFDLSSVHEWVVTHKTGAARVANHIIALAPAQMQRIRRFIASMASSPDYALKRSRSMPPSAAPNGQFSPFGSSTVHSAQPENGISRLYLQICRSVSAKNAPPGQRGWISPRALFPTSENFKSEGSRERSHGVLQFDGESLGEGNAPQPSNGLLEEDGNLQRSHAWSMKNAEHILFGGWSGRIYNAELVCSLLLFISASLSVAYKEEASWLRIFITAWTFLQAAAFFQMGIGYIGTKRGV